MDNKLLSKALRAICLTRDYVGDDLLPAIKGWEWYDVGMEIAEKIPADEWAIQFMLRVEAFNNTKHLRYEETTTADGGGT